MLASIRSACNLNRHRATEISFIPRFFRVHYVLLPSKLRSRFKFASKTSTFPALKFMLVQFRYKLVWSEVKCLRIKTANSFNLMPIDIWSLAREWEFLGFLGSE